MDEVVDEAELAVELLMDALLDQTANGFTIVCADCPDNDDDDVFFTELLHELLLLTVVLKLLIVLVLIVPNVLFSTALDLE